MMPPTKSNFQPLNDLLVRGVRDQKPSQSMIPAKFAAYEVIDLYKRLKVIGITETGSIANGISDVGWEVEVGWTGELDLAVFIPAGTVVGQLQPKLTVSSKQLTSGMLVIQRLPQKVVFPADAQGNGASIWETDKPISFLTMGALDGKGGKKKSAELNFSCDLQIGKGLIDSVTPAIKDKPPGEDNRGFFEGDNSLYMGLGLGITGKVGVTWSRLIEPHPGQYDQVMSQEILDDFSAVIGVRTKAALKRDIYKWLRSVALSKVATLTAANRTKVEKTVQNLIRTPRAMVKGTDMISTILAAAVAQDNPLLGTVRAFKAFQTNPSTVKMIQNLQSFAHSFYAEVGSRTAEETQQINQSNWFIDQLYLQKPYEGGQAEVFWWLYNLALQETATNAQVHAKVQKAFNVKKGMNAQATALRDALSSFYGRDTSYPLLRTATALVTWIGRKTSPNLAEALKLQAMQVTTYKTAALQNNVAITQRAQALAQKIETIVAEAKKTPQEHNRAQLKRGAVHPPAGLNADIAKKLTYYDLLAFDGEFGGESGPKVIVPLWAQVLVAGSAGLTAKLDVRGRHSKYRFQTLCSSRRINGNPLIVTQDTSMTYSQTKVGARLWADMVAFNAQPAVSPTTLNEAYEKGRRIDESQFNKISKRVESVNTLNAFDYISAVAYWRYPTAAVNGPVQVGQGSGIRMGISMLVQHLVYLSTHPDKNEEYTEGLLENIKKYTGIDQATLTRFLRFAKIDELAKRGSLPESLILEAGYELPQNFGLELKDKKNGYYQAKNILNHDAVETMIKELRGDSATRPRPTVLRLRMRLADWLDDSNVYFKLGLWGNAMLGIKLRPIYQAEQSALVDLATFHLGSALRNMDRPAPPLQVANQGNQINVPQQRAYANNLAVWEAEQLKIVPPAAILHQ